MMKPPPTPPPPSTYDSLPICTVLPSFCLFMTLSDLIALRAYASRSNSFLPIAYRIKFDGKVKRLPRNPVGLREFRQWQKHVSCLHRRAVGGPSERAHLRVVRYSDKSQYWKIAVVF